MSESSGKPAWPAHVRHLRLGDVLIDLHCRRLRLGETDEVELPQRVFDLLLVFVAEPGVLHTRNALLQRVWAGLVVEDSNLSQSVWAVRRALGEARKDWLRTIAKRGYVFEPPMPVDIVGGPEPARAPELPGGAARDARGRRWWGWALAASVAATAVAGWALSREHPGTAAGPTSFTLIEVDDPDAAATDRVPAGLLHAWLDWKLGATPGISVLTEPQLAASDPLTQSRNATLLLSSGSVSAQPGRIFVQVRFEDAAGRTRRLRREGGADQADALADALSREVYAQLLAAHAHRPWPRLQVAPAVAPKLVAMFRARALRDWQGAARLGREVTAQAPGLGLAHLYQARTLGVLAQLPQALEHLGAARRLLRPVPPDVDQVLHALQLVLSSQHAQAAQAYAALARKWPKQRHYVLQQANALARAGRAGDGLALLNAPRWREPMPLGTRLAYLTSRSNLELRLGDHAAALASAKAARDLAAAAGRGWDHEHAQALNALGQADAYWATRGQGSPYFEQAAQRFERAGDRFAALRARFLGEIVAPGRAPSPQLDAWLAQARAAGQRQLELDALRVAAAQSYRAGDIEGWRRRLRQAQASADAMDDAWGRASMDVDLLNEAYHRGDLAAVRARLARLRSSGMQGEVAIWAEFFAAIIAIDRGEYAAARDAIARGDRHARAMQQPATRRTLAGIFDCPRAFLALSAGHPALARRHYTQCGQTDAIDLQMARIGLAELAWLTGDRQQALRLVQQVRDGLEQVASEPARWALSLDVAALLTRTGDTGTAAALYRASLAHAQRAGFLRLEAFARVGLAENALARGEMREAAQQAALAQARVDPGLWALSHRLQLVQASLARADGDVDRASRRLLALHRAAHARNDLVVQILVHGAMERAADLQPCPPAERERLVAASGLRGASVEWMEGARGGARLTAIR